MKQSQVTKLLAVLSAAYPAAMSRMTSQERQATCEIYETMLMDLDYESAHAAVIAHVTTSRFWPSIAEIRAQALERTLGLPSPEQALAMVRNFERKKICVLPQEVAKALEYCGGLWELRNTTNQTTWRAQFRAAYQSLRNEAMRRHAIEPVLERAGLPSGPSHRTRGQLPFKTPSN